MLPKVLKGFNLFIDGRGYAGRIEEVTLPKLVNRTEEYRLGGLDTPVQVDMGMEKLECDLTLSEYDVHLIKSFGIDNESLLINTMQRIGLGGTTGLTPRGLIPLSMRGGLSDEVDDKVVPVVINAEGSIVELDMGQWRAGEKTTLKIRLALRYYRLTVDNESLIEIDVDNRIRQVAGKDQIRPRGLLSGIL